MDTRNKRELWRWLIWAIVLISLFVCGRSLIHLKHMELFLLCFTLGCVALVLIFRKLRDKT